MSDTSQSGIDRSYRDPKPPFLIFVFLASFVVATLIGWYEIPFRTSVLNTGFLVMATIGALVSAGRFLYLLKQRADGGQRR